MNLNFLFLEAAQWPDLGVLFLVVTEDHHRIVLLTLNSQSSIRSTFSWKNSKIEIIERKKTNSIEDDFIKHPKRY